MRETAVRGWSWVDGITVAAAAVTLLVSLATHDIVAATAAAVIGAFVLLRRLGYVRWVGSASWRLLRRDEEI